jgi:hypothetical protein
MTDAPTPPDGLVSLFQKGAAFINTLNPDTQKAVRYAVYEMSERDLIPWVNSQEGQEVTAVVTGILGKILGGGAAGPIAAGIEQGTDATIRQLVAILTTAPTAPGATT